MAYEFTGSSSQYVSTASTPVSGPPVTLAIWVWPKATGAFYFELQQNGGTNNRDRIRILPSGSNVSANTVVESPYVEASSITSGTFVRESWNHIAGVFASTASRIAYLNGVAATTNTTTVTCRPMAKININAIEFTFGSNIAFGNGYYAEAGIWNVALTTDEIASLAKGFSCRRIRPQSLRFYAPLIRDLQDVQRALALTNNNAATPTPHPRIYT